MTKNEALDFLGLTKEAVQNDILVRYKDRYNYFQMQFNNAPNAVLKNIQRLNLEKLDAIKQLLLINVNWAESSSNFQLSGAQSVSDKIISTSHPVNNSPVAWLITHTENKKTKTFDLFDGLNYIGRKTTVGQRSIVIDDDDYVSRLHAVIKCAESLGKRQFTIYDGDMQKVSKNGVYLNGNEDRVEHSASLADGDTIQIGLTKLVLKESKDTNKDQEIKEVEGAEFMKTIVIDILQ